MIVAVHNVLDCSGFNGLMVMISVSHTEGSQFDPALSHFLLLPHLIPHDVNNAMVALLFAAFAY